MFWLVGKKYSYEKNYSMGIFSKQNRAPDSRAKERDNFI
jgi:hypothetical protein